MSADDTVDPAVAEGTDRRTALKKAAIAAGVVAWTTPAVQAVTARPAFAQTVTGCGAAVTSIAAILTGPNCKQCPGAPGLPSCCSGTTYFFQTINATCGPNCNNPPPTVGLIDVPGGVKPGLCKSDRFLDNACASSTVTLTAKVTCADGVTYTVTNTVPITCDDCLPLISAADLSTSDVIEDELLEPPPDTATDASGSTDTPIEQPAPSAQDPPSDQPATTVPAAGESPPGGGEPPGDQPETAPPP